jgi:hypothetical protein
MGGAPIAGGSATHATVAIDTQRSNMNEAQHRQRDGTGRRLGVLRFLAHIGALRIAITVCVLALLPLTFVRGRLESQWHALPDYVAPVLVALLVWGLLFDLLMARVLMREGVDPGRSHYRSVLALDIGLILLLLLFWGPFFVSLLTA